MSNIDILNNIFNAFKIQAICKSYAEYKNASFYDVELKPGGRLKDLHRYSAEFSLALKASSQPKINIIPEKGIVRFEFIKNRSEKVSLIELGNMFKRPVGELTCLMGETPMGEPVWMDMVQNPHLLVAGTSGSGKSTVLHTIVANMLMYPKTQVYLMDPKSIEFCEYESINNIKISYSFDECLNTLHLLNDEMDARYAKIKENKNNINSFPYIVLIIDEFADIRLNDTNNDFHKQLCRLAQKSRAAKIHIVLATQRPSANVVDGLIKANFPSRLSCKVASGVDSKVVLDAMGAEDLRGNGDAIIHSPQFNYQRFQSAYVNAAQVCKYFAINK